MHTLPLLFSFFLDVLDNAIKSEKTIGDIKMWKGEVKWSLFANDINDKTI